MKKLLGILTLFPVGVFANPTSGWNEDYSYGDVTGDFNTFPYVLLLLAIFLGPYLISKVINIFKSNKKEPETVEPNQQETLLNDVEEEAKKEDVYTHTYKKHAKELTKQLYDKKDNKYQTNTGNREPIYISIILILCMLMYYQYSQYRLDSFSRTVNCFRDVVPENDVDFCESFYEKYRE